MLSVLNIVLLLGLSYLVGSIPTSIVVARLFKGIDIREHGSGNAGGTNTFRVLGKIPALIVVIVDVLKGVFAAYVISHWIFTDLQLSRNEMNALKLACGLAAVFGHIYTAFAGFRGGKGVATGVGMFMGTFPLGIAFAFPVFVLVVMLTGYVSLSSMLAATAIPLSLILMDETGLREVPTATIWFSIGVAFLMLFTHRSNIKRLMEGKENRFGKKKSSSNAKS